MVSPQRTNPTTGGHRRGVPNQSTNQRINNTETPLQKLQAQARGFRRTGPDQGVMCCTAPDHDDKHPSLCWRELPDGRLLLFCQAGCETADVLAGAGLSMADLFPDSGRDHGRPVPRGQRWDYRELLRLLRYESVVVICAANDVVHGNVITEADKNRLIQAATRIARVAEVAK